jgi:hypothetical protein
VYPAAEGDFPLALGNAESSAIAIQFTVPDTSVASNLVTHDYTVEVDYEDQIAPTVGMQISDSLGIGDGSNTRFPFDYEWSVDPGSVKVYLDGEPTTGFHQDCLYPGVILDSPPAPGISVTADYELVEEIWPGQDSRTCYLEHSPVVPGSERIYVDCVLWSAYRIDYDTGKITFDTPPTTHYAMRANYDYYGRWSFGGHDFAVYHSDQNQAMTLRQRLTAAGAPEVNTARSRELLVTSGMESRMGDQQ